MQAARIFSVAVLIALAVFGQDTAEPKPKPKRPALPSDLQSIHDLAMAAPPEFAADALLRLAASPKIADRKLKRELIEQALQLAPRAQNAYERVAVPGTATDTRSGFLAAALALRLDALSLQARAIAGLLALDKAAAVTALNAVPHPNIAALKCDDPLVPDLSAYYAALGAVVEQALNNDPDERTRFLLSAISRMSSVAEVSPVARLLAQVKMANDEAQIVYGAFLTQIRALPADPRSLTFYASHITTDLNDVMYRVSQLPGREELTEQVRTILRRHMEAQRCRDLGVANIAGRPSGQEPDTAKVDAYWQTDAAKQMFEACALLRFRPNGSMITDAERATPEWARQLTDFLRNWRRGGRRTKRRKPITTTSAPLCMRHS